MDVYNTLLQVGRKVCENKYKISKNKGSLKTKYTLYFYKGFLFKKNLVKVIVLVEHKGNPDNKIQLYFKSEEYRKRYKEEIKKILKKYLPSSIYFNII